MNIEFSTADGVLLKGRLLKADAAKAVVLLNPGTATKTAFYSPFAEFLAANGYHVLLWNYRGFCESRLGSLKGSDISFSDIGQYDVPAAIAKAKALFPDLPLYCVGHSAGGQQIGYAPNCDDVKGLVAIAVSTGYFGGMPLAYRRKAKFFFSLFSPISTLLFGYVKAEKFNLMEDLPPKLAKEWGQWCAKPDFFFDPVFAKAKPHLAQYRTLNFPIQVLTADDDEISSPLNVEQLWKHIRSTQPIHFKQYKAADMPKGAVGHFGYFRKANQAVWQDVLAALDGFSAA